jgi:hypoxanthine phosphoribosyltransferase
MDTLREERLMQDQLRCELISWADVERRCRRLASRIRASGFSPDLIIAIGRGGYVPARLLCDNLHIMALTSIKVEHYLAGANRQREALIRYPLKADIHGLRVLLVDDVNDTGDTLALAVQHLQSFQPAAIRTAVMHQKSSTSIQADYCARRIIKWRWLVYPWAINEDITDFLKRLSPKSLEDARRLLSEHFAIRMPLRRLRTIYESMSE